MCLAIPAKIIEIEESNNYAKVTILGVESEVNIQLIEQPGISDYVLVHAGCAIQRIDMEYFKYLHKVYETWLEED